MKYFLTFIVILFASISFMYTGNNITNAGIFSIEGSQIPYCNDKNKCGLNEGMKSIKQIDALENNKKASVFIQDIVKYVLGFLALIATIIIIYAGFQLLTGMGDEEKAKDTKKIIIYAIVGLIIIFLAGPLIKFVLKALYLP